MPQTHRTTTELCHKHNILQPNYATNKTYYNQTMPQTQRTTQPNYATNTTYYNRTMPQTQRTTTELCHKHNVLQPNYATKDFHQQHKNANFYPGIFSKCFEMMIRQRLLSKLQNITTFLRCFLNFSSKKQTSSTGDLLQVNNNIKTRSSNLRQFGYYMTQDN